MSASAIVIERVLINDVHIEIPKTNLSKSGWYFCQKIIGKCYFDRVSTNLERKWLLQRTPDKNARIYAFCGGRYLYTLCVPPLFGNFFIDLCTRIHLLLCRTIILLVHFRYGQGALDLYKYFTLWNLQDHNWNAPRE